MKLYEVETVEYDDFSDTDIFYVMALNLKMALKAIVKNYPEFEDYINEKQYEVRIHKPNKPIHV
jgi:predicted nucleotidyltransferase